MLSKQADCTRQRMCLVMSIRWNSQWFWLSFFLGRSTGRHPESIIQVDKNSNADWPNVHDNR